MAEGRPSTVSAGLSWLLAGSAAPAASPPGASLGPDEPAAAAPAGGAAPPGRFASEPAATAWPSSGTAGPPGRFGSEPAAAAPPPGRFGPPERSAGDSRAAELMAEILTKSQSKTEDKNACTSYEPDQLPDKAGPVSESSDSKAWSLLSNLISRGSSAPADAAGAASSAASSLERVLAAPDGPAPAARPPPPPLPSWLGSEPAAQRPSLPEDDLGQAPQGDDDAASDGSGGPRAEREEFAGRREERRQASKRLTFDTYLDEATWKEGVASGRFVKGTLRCSGAKLKTAHVVPTGFKPREQDLAVIGKKCRNRAVHGDVVVCELLPDREEAQSILEEEEEGEEPFRAPPGLALPDSDSDEEVVFSGPLVAAQDPETAAAGAASSRRGRNRDRPKLAKVVAIAERKGSDRVIVCTLHPNDVGTSALGHSQEVKETDKFIKAKPTDARMPWILLKINDVTRRVLNIPGPLDKFQLWPVQMVTWDEKASLPLGRLKGQCLGQAGDLEAEEKHALMEHGLDCHDVDFDDGILDEVDGVVMHAKEDFEREVTKRLDLRRKRIFTIDPATARDLDDAIHVDDCGRHIEVGVHIADVGHFLKLGSQADLLAQERTTSVYLINRVLPMLPHALCNHLCSLNPNEPKLSFSVHFRLDKETGDLVEHGEYRPRFNKTAMCSVCRMNYDEVQVVLDEGDLGADEIPAMYGGWSWSEIRDDLFLLYDVCGKVRTGRMEGGALRISKHKMIFHTRESEDGTPTGYHLESHSASHWIIEELMLLANRCVAKFLAQDPRLHHVGVLRRHEPPEPEKALELEMKLRDNLGIDWKQGNAYELHKSCQMIRQKYGDTLGLCIDMMVMRAGMMQAQYFVHEDGADTHHFALNFDYYTHFTSPIRRYPDVMVHRVLDAILSDGEDGFQDVEEANAQVDICNDKKLACRRCSEQIDRAIFCIYLRRIKEWFYTIGTVLSFHKDRNEGGIDTVTVYCAQLGKESKARLCADGDLESMDLITGGPDDQLLMPLSWEFKSRGALEVRWPDSEDDRRVGRKQVLRTLSCIPVVIIPTNTVPIDYAMFFVSPSHKDYKSLMARVRREEVDGFEWREQEEEGVEVIHDAHAPLGGGDS